MSAVWIITDGKPGHYNQSLGLALALKRQQPALSVETLPILSKRQLLKMMMGFALPSALQSLITQESPKLIIAAGHATHSSLLILGWRLHAKTILMMTPSLPTRWFDLCLIPAHDQPSVASHIIETQGALNPMLPAEKKPQTGILLIGGPSKHHAWDEESLFEQLNSLLVDDPRDWIMTSSRRTPDSTLKKLHAIKGVNFLPHTETPQGWLAEQLAIAENAWVTADSVSMVYEALTAGCRVGVLEVPEAKKGSRSRLAKGLGNLINKKWIQYGVYSQLNLTNHELVFNEAQRCAQEICNRGWV